MIRLNNVYQKYGNKTILKDISLTIPDGQITAIIGQNGAGKSTLFNVISHLIPHQSGSITIDEVKSTTKRSELAKIIAVLKQQNHFNLKLTTHDLITFGRYPHSKGKLTSSDYEKIEEVLIYLNIHDIRNQFIDTLSGGQLQRVLLAMIIVQDTKYILLDEPLNNLDMKYAIETMQLLQKMVKELNKTIVVVMHDINMTTAFCDYIVAIKAGSIIFEGNKDDIMDERILENIYDHPFYIKTVDGKKLCVYQK